MLTWDLKDKINAFCNEYRFNLADLFKHATARSLLRDIQYLSPVSYRMDLHNSGLQ
ncbi:hypothetical protein [Bartonella tamiae]|uniref:hypothetical protein n=1 Tax=Bartonella tamiae TaxID=373638 RepID=UPI0002F18C32|nr:hypothetical protein [Bartonella tamiae]